MRSRAPGPKLYAYLAREAALPFAAALIGLTSVVLAQDMIELLPLTSRGVPGESVARIAGFKAIPMLSAMLPFSALLGILVALGRLAADRELLVLQACGISGPQLIRPALMLAAFLTIPALLLQTVLAPWAHRGQQDVWEEIVRERPWSQIQAARVSRFGTWQIYAREVSAEGSTLVSVLVWTEDLGETLFAKNGRIEVREDGAADLILHDAALLRESSDDPTLLRFEQLQAKLPQTDRPLSAKAADDPIQALPLAELRERAAAFDPVDRPGKTTVSQHGLEFHRRFALPFATLTFGLLAVPLFLSRSNHSRASGGVMGVLVTLGYYGLVQASNGLIERFGIATWLGAWIPNLVVAGVALALLARTTKTAGWISDRPQRGARQLRQDTASPGRTHAFALDRYVARRFATLALLCTTVIVIGYLLIDVLDRLEWFARHEATPIETLRYYGARIWVLISRSVAMGLLVATGLTVSLLAAEGELLGMRACGISAARALLPVLILSLIATPLYFAFSNWVVPRMNAVARDLKMHEIYDRPRDGVSERPVWYPSGNQLVETKSLDTDRGRTRGHLTVYDLDESGLPTARLDASSGLHQGRGRWRVYDAQQIRLDEDGVPRRTENVKYLQLGSTLQAETNMRHLSFQELDTQITESRLDGLDATELEVERYTRIAQPLACFVLPLTVLLYAVAGPPFPGPAATLFTSAVLGVSYILVTGVAASFGHGRTFSPLLAAWSPTLLYTALACVLGARLWRRL
jgi:LPS export ABC transporter permease LptF/LPS export ABC transporter permease LptG